jgi:protein phosphatase
MRGIQGSLLGYRLQQPHLLGCLNDRNELSLISVGQSHDGCNLLRVDDLRPSERTQVIAGLPTGSLDDAIGQIHKLVPASLLPICSPPAPPATPAPPSPPPKMPDSAPPSAPPTSPTLTSAPPTPGPTAEPAPPSGDTAAPTAPGQPQPSLTPLPVPTTTTVTTLPPAPQEPGKDCRTAA